MKAHTTIKPADRKADMDKIKQYVKTGKLDVPPFKEGKDLSMTGFKPKKKKELSKNYAEGRMQRALERDARYSISGGVWMRRHGLSQAFREVYTGSKQLVDNGAK